MSIAERKTREHQSRIKLIKRSASVMFEKKGFEAAKMMEEIAERAEISKATIYKYFKSKNKQKRSLLRSDAGTFCATEQGSS